MEIIVSAIMGELAGRSISFLIDKYSKPIMEERLYSLQRLLLRLRVIVEEAEERHITNQAMLQQLNILRKEMYRGYYTLDSFRCQAHGENKVKEHEVSPSFAPSKFNRAKRVCFCSGSSQSVQGLLEQVLGNLEQTIGGVSEFVMFLNGCPRLYRQPYSMYLLLDKCMFNRQIEMEHIINFLLQAETPGAENPGVLPIIGPGKVGKSTLIEHACDDERVRNHFSQILCFSGDDLKDGSVVTLTDGGVVKHQNRNMDGGKTLIVIELVGDIDECVWERLYSASKGRVASGSKIIVASRSEKIASFGTAQALRVRFFTPEAFWYFFKVRTFGSMDAEEHPKLASIAMDIARGMNGCFVSATILSVLLKANFNLHFWSMVLASQIEFSQKNLLLHGANFACPWNMVEPIYVRRVNRSSSEYLVILDDYETGSAQTLSQSSAQSEAEGSKMSVQDLFYGNVRPQGKFKVLAWRSHLPPYYNYMFNCDIRRPQRMVAGKKRFQKNSSS